MRILVLVVLLLLSFDVVLVGQDFDRYVPLTCEGDLPALFLKRSSSKYEAQVEELVSASDRKQDKKSKKTFLLQSNFLIDEMLLSGRVLFNDPVGNYITRVKDLLLKDQPDLREKIRIFVVRSPAVNAFCTNDGIVLVNMGLIARLKSESQLAYILSHEFQHFIQQHPINRYVKTEAIKEDFKGVLQDNAYDRFLLAKNQYSRELEEEADELGLDLLLRSEYGTGDLVPVFDILKRSSLPLEEAELDYSQFESAGLVIPADCRLLKVDSVSLGEENIFDELLSSHPSADNREALLVARLEAETDQDRGNGPKHLISKDDFLMARNRCRFDLSRILLDQGRYERGIYHTYLLLQDFPESFYLRKLMAFHLYSLARYSNEDKFEKVHIDPEDVQGALQRVPYLTENLDRDELTILATVYCWKLFLEHPDDAELEGVCEHLLKDFMLNFPVRAESMAQSFSPEFFSFRDSIARVMAKQARMAAEEHDPEGEVLDDPEGELRADPEGEVLDDPDGELRADGQSPDDDPEGDQAVSAEAQEAARSMHFQYAFAEFFSNDRFQDAWNNALEEEEEEAYISNREYTRRKRRALLKGVKLGADKVVFLSPIYRKVNESSKSPMDFIESENLQLNVVSWLDEIGNRVGLETDILYPKQSDNSSAKRFNDLVLIRSWIGEFFEHDGMEMVSIRQDETKQLMEDYGTPYFSFIGGVNLKRRDKANVFTTCFALVFPIYLPFYLINILVPKNKALYINLVFDLDSGKLAMQEFREIKQKHQGVELRSTLYNSLIQMKSK